MENEILQPIVLTVGKNKDRYTLEFDLDAVHFAEARGFEIEKVSGIAITPVEDLFFYSFRKHHKNVSREKTDKILHLGLGGIKNLPDGFIKRLIQLYLAPFDALSEKDENFAATVEM